MSHENRMIIKQIMSFSSQINVNREYILIYSLYMPKLYTIT